MALTQVQSGMLGADSQNYGFKNRIINGAMMIDQRNAGASVTPSSDAYTLDRWTTWTYAASKFSVQQNAGSVTPPTGFVNYLGITSTSAYSVPTGEGFAMMQKIEGYNMADLGWGAVGASSVTLSFWVRSSLTGTFGGALNNSAQTRSYPFSYAINSANTWEYKTVTIAGDTTGTWLTTNGAGILLKFGLGVGATLSGTAGTWAGANYASATGAVSVIGTNAATFYITGVQLEKGSTATSFDYRPYGTELALCQRYLPCFRYDTGSTILPSQFGFNAGVNNGRGAIMFPVQTRTQPNGFTISSAAHFSAYDNNGGVLTGASTGFVSAGQLAACIDFNVSSGGSTNRSFTIGITNSAGYIYFNGCEL